MKSCTSKFGDGRSGRDGMTALHNALAAVERDVPGHTMHLHIYGLSKFDVVTKYFLGTKITINPVEKEFIEEVMGALKDPKRAADESKHVSLGPNTDGDSTEKGEKAHVKHKVDRLPTCFAVAVMYHMSTIDSVKYHGVPKSYCNEAWMKDDLEKTRQAMLRTKSAAMKLIDDGDKLSAIMQIVATMSSD